MSDLGRVDTLVDVVRRVMEVNPLGAVLCARRAARAVTGSTPSRRAQVSLRAWERSGRVPG